MKSIGIVREAYSVWERRAPFTPEQVRRIVERLGVQVNVQPSGKRVFPDSAYAAAGARITDDLTSCNAVFGVKQVPMDDLIPNKTYLFFSHTIKGQLENMALLEEIKRRNVRLIDYECITRDGKPGAPRLVAFGEYAGRAGMIDSFRGIGQQLLYNGVSTPFLGVGSSYMYPSYAEAAAAVQRAGRGFVDEWRDQPLTRFNPLVFLFTGSGNVNRGARQVFDLTPSAWVAPEELPDVLARGDTSQPLIGCQVGLEDMVERRGGSSFDKDEFYQHPELYRSVFFDRVARHANVLVNGLYWDARYPRVVCKADLVRHKDSSRLHFISDISCDVGGGIECLQKSTTIEDPFVMVEDPPEASNIMMLGVDILPSELPREASQHFGDYLLPFVAQLAAGEATDALAPELRGACIADRGALSARYQYIDKMKAERMRELNGLPAVTEHTQLQLEGSTVIRLQGHLFDSGLINRMLDVVEGEQGRFHIVECLVGANQESTVMLQVTLDDGRDQRERVLAEFRALAASPAFAAAKASVEEVPDFCKGNYRATILPNSAAAARARGAEKDAAGGMDNAAPEITRPVDWVPLKTVAVLGAGMVAKPCVELLSRDSSRNVVVCGAAPGEAASLCNALGRSNLQPLQLNAVQQPDDLERLIARCDAVISLLPQTMHAEVAKLCVQHRTPLVTASYVSAEMRQLEDAARERGVPILCEMGLDPGMDHMSAMMVIDSIKEGGGEVKSFTSVCGGLTAPEDANNPFGYKFSWSPMGVLRAMRNDARFLRDGKTIEVKGGFDLVSASQPFRVHMLPSLALEQLPNRDSLVYADKYSIQEAQTCFRGTLRYEGFCAILAGFFRAGLLEENVAFKDALSSLRGSSDFATSVAAMDWLLAEGSPISDEQAAAPALDVLASVLQARLALQPGERDLCVMQHTFNDDLVSTMLAYGNSSDTGMARTVGLTAAIGADLFLDPPSASLDGTGGIFLPTEKRIYTPALDRLASEGLVFNHHTR